MSDRSTALAIQLRKHRAAETTVWPDWLAREAINFHRPAGGLTRKRSDSATLPNGMSALLGMTLVGSSRASPEIRRV